MTGPNESAVTGWIAEVQDELAQVDSELAPLLEKQSALTERLGLLKRLLATLGGDSREKANDSGRDGATAYIRTYPTVRERVQSQVAEILAAAGGQLHINDIHAEFIKRGFEVPGAGKPNNITVHLSDAASISSTARGYYELKGSNHAQSTIRYPVADETRSRRTRG